METAPMMPFPPLPVIPTAIVSLIIAASVQGRPFSAIGHSMQQRQQQQRLHEDAQAAHQQHHYQQQPSRLQTSLAINYPTTMGSTMEEESHKSSELLLRGVRMHELSAFVILVVCLVLTIALVLFVGFYCLIHCWRHHKNSHTAAHRRALIQTSIVSTAIDEMAPPSSPPSRLSSRRSTFARLSIFGGRIGGHSSRSPSTARSVRGRYLDDYSGKNLKRKMECNNALTSDMALLNGKLPQIRISFSSAGQDSPDSRCRSRKFYFLGTQIEGK